MIASHFNKTVDNNMLPRLTAINAARIKSSKLPILSRTTHNNLNWSIWQGGSSHSKFSQCYSWHLAKQNFHKVWHGVQAFVSLKHFRFFYQFMTVKPAPKYRTRAGIEAMNRAIIPALRKNASMGLILADKENTWQFEYDNYHLHYLIISTAKIGRRPIKKAVKDAINDNDTFKPEAVDKVYFQSVYDVKHLCSYLTKQAGYLPVMSKRNKNPASRNFLRTQWQIFKAMPPARQAELLIHDAIVNRGIVRQHIYYNSKNTAAKIVKREAKLGRDASQAAKEEQARRDGIIIAKQPTKAAQQKESCRITNVLYQYNCGITPHDFTKQDKARQVKRQQQEAKHAAVMKRYHSAALGHSISLITPASLRDDKANFDLDRDVSKHHYSERESIYQFLGLNIYTGKPLKRKSSVLTENGRLRLLNTRRSKSSLPKHKPQQLTLIFKARARVDVSRDTVPVEFRHAASSNIAQNHNNFLHHISNDTS